MLGAGISGQGGFQFLDLGTHDVLAMVQDLLDTGVDRVTQDLVLFFQINELHGVYACWQTPSFKI
ncbi:hypothetical protein D3C85_1772900 [compost metagenome]